MALHAAIRKTNVKNSSADLTALGLKFFLGVVEMHADKQGLSSLEQRCWQNEIQHQSEMLSSVKEDPIN